MSMHLNRKTLQNACKIVINFEKARKQLIDEGKYQECYISYSFQTVFLPDNNDGNFWDKKLKHIEFKSPIRNWREEIVTKHIKNGERLLNIGVGDGQLEEKLYKRKKIEYYGSDITTEVLSYLRNKFSDYKFINSDINSLVFENCSFDSILLMEVLEHIKPTETFNVLKKINSLLKENGKLIISVPLFEGLEKMLPNNPNSHMRFYSRELLFFELRKAGFIIDHFYEASAFPKLFSLKNLINNIFHIKQPNNILVIAQKK